MAVTSTAEENLKTVWLDILDWYQRLGVDNKFAQLKPTMFSTKSSPKLKGKAGEVKDLVQVLHKVWLKYLNPLLEIHRKIEIVLRTSAHMGKVLEEGYGEFVLSSRGYNDLEATGMMHLDVFWQLRQYFAEENYPLFQLTSKGHYLMHCCFLSKCLSPACSWAYTGEDFMGKCRDLAQSSPKRGHLVASVKQDGGHDMTMVKN